MVTLPIGELFEVQKGVLQSSRNVEGEFTFITASEGWKTHISYTHECEALVFAMGASGSLGRTHYINGKFIASDLCFILAPSEPFKDKLDLKFYHNLFNYLRSVIVRNIATGTSKLAINITNFKRYQIPYFDIDVQLIFSKLLEDVNWNNERLNLELEIQTKLIAQLRQALLQEAVQGRLVPQDPTDEPASELLKQIKAEKQRLTRARKIKKEKPLPPISDAEIPYELPEGWVWVRLGQLAKLLDYGASQKASFIANGIPVLGMNNIKDGEVIYNNFKYIPSTIKDLPRLYLKKNDLLFNRTNSYELVGKTGIHKKEDDSFTFASYLIRVSLLQNFTAPDFINFYFSTPTCRKTQIEPYITQQTGQANFNGTKLKNVIIPLPPLNEQKRIVAKVDELMRLCDELEEQIRQSKEESERLMQAVLREAFEGKDVEESNAEVSVA